MRSETEDLERLEEDVAEIGAVSELTQAIGNHLVEANMEPYEWR